MTSLRFAAFLLLLVGFAFSLNVSDYLFANETNATINYTNFTVNGTSYSLVKINGAETFLLKGGNIVSDKPELSSVLYSYFSRLYYPNKTELDELKSLIDIFNKSRNDGYDFKGKEEYVCRDDILLSNGKITVSGEPVRCVDNETCEKNAMLLYSVYGEGLGLGSPSVILDPLMQFTPYSLEIDRLLSNYSQRLATANESNIADTLRYIKNTSVNLKNLSLKIESTIFRTPRLNDTADRKACEFKCWAICPSFDLNQSAADQIVLKSGQLADKVVPLTDFTSLSNNVYNRTVTRQDHLKKENQAKFYEDALSPLNETGAEAIALGEEAVARISNTSLSARLDSLKSLHETIPDDLSKRIFTTMDADIETYKSLQDEVSGRSLILLTQYNSTRDAKNTANSLILVLESKDLDPVSRKSMLVLENETEDLDAQFRDGLTMEESAALETEYGKISERAQDLLKSESDTPATRVLLLFRGFARNVNSGIAQVAEQTDTPPAEIPGGPVIFLFSLLVFLSSASLLILLFLYVFATVRFTVPQTGHILAAALILLVSLLLALSVFTYLFLGRTSNDATLPEFLSDLNSKQNVSVVVDLRNASFADAAAMKSCGSTLAGSLEEKNKTPSIFTLTQNTCTLSYLNGTNRSLSSSECLKDIRDSESSFVLSYSQANQPPRFSVIYQSKAEIRANLDYYESCPLMALFT